MRFEYTGRHVEVTPALKEHVESHFGKISHLFGNEADRAHVTIEVEHGKHLSEVVVKWKHDILNARSSHEDMYQSISESINKVEKQALKAKNKIIDRSHRAQKLTETQTEEG